MKKKGLAGGQLFAFKLKFLFLTFISTSSAFAVQHVSHLGSREAAQSSCIAEGSGLVNTYGGALCQGETYYGSRKIYFSFCRVDDRRTGCGYGADIYKFTYPIPYEESIVDQFYETSRDSHRACSADLAAKTNNPRVLCRGLTAWNDNQGNSIGYTVPVTGYIVNLNPQTIPSWLGYSCSNLYAWHGSIRWCQQTNFRSYFGGCPSGTEPDPNNYNRCESVADEPFKGNGSPCSGDQSGPTALRNGSAGSVGNMVGNPCHAGTGNKYEAETDFAGALTLKRSYNSQGQRAVGFGMGWTSNLHKSLSIFGNSLLVYEADGRSEKWTREEGVWVGNVDTRLQIAELPVGFRLTRPDGNQEIYDARGSLVSEVDTNGNTTLFTYDTNDLLIGVRGPYGHTISLGYDGEARIVRVFDSADTEYRFSYNGENLSEASVVMPGNPTRSYLYEDDRFPHHLTGLIDENGDRYATWAYDADGRAVLTTHSPTTNGIGQQQFELRYDGDETLVTDAGGNTSIWTFDENNAVKRLLTRHSLVDGKGITQDFDDRNNLTARMDEEGRRTTLAYNQANQSIFMVEGAGSPEERTIGFDYISSDIDLVTGINEPSVYFGQRRETRVNYDSGLNPTSVELRGFDPTGLPQSRIHRFTYSGDGLVTAYDGPRTDIEDISTLEYHVCDTGNECGQLARFRNAAGHLTSFHDYDGAGRLLRSTDENGVTVTNQYDLRGRLLNVIRTAMDGDSRNTAFSYDLAGQMVAVETADGITLKYYYDAAHDLRAIGDNLGNRVEFTYDARGNRKTSEMIDPDGSLIQQTELAYNIRNHLEMVSAGESMTQWMMDATGNSLEQTDPNYNPPTRFQFDGLNRLREQTNADGNYTSYEYDAADQLVQVTAPNGAETRYSVDDLGNRLSEGSPDRGLVSNTFDEAGNITSTTDARGVTVRYRYDGLNRLLEASYPESSEDSRYEYDFCEYGVGRICRVHGPDGVTSFRYDAWGNIARIVLEGGGQIYTTSYRYDAGNRIIQIVDPAGLQLDYVRDGVGRVADVRYSYQGDSQTLLAGREYRADGVPVRQVLGNGLEESREYDLQGRLVTQELRPSGYEAGDGDPALLDQRHYSYDANGNLLDIDITPDPQLPKGKKEVAFSDPSWTYDVLDRVITGNGLESYQYDYDSNGNLIYRYQLDKKNGIVYAYRSLSNRLEFAGYDGVITDASGNTISDRGGERGFTYNQRGRMASVTENGILKATYEYNAFNQRTAKQLYDYRTPEDSVVASDLVHFHYGLDGMMIGEHVNGVPKRSYVRVDGQPIAQIEYKGNGEISRIIYITVDHLATPRLGSSEEGQIIWRWDSEAYGSAIPDKKPGKTKGTVNIPLRFPGQYADEESGLFYNWNRYYYPETGRYMTSDPIGLDGGMNTYSYGFGNPNRFTDPTGQIAPVIAVCASNPFCIALASTEVAAVGYGLSLAWQQLTQDDPIEIDPNRPIPPQLPGYIDPSSTLTSTVAQSCPIYGGPPLDPRERCFNGVRLQFAACMQHGTNPLLCQAKRLLGIMMCSARSPEDDDDDNYGF